MTVMELCTTGLASFMMGVNTLTLTMFFGEWLHRQITGADQFNRERCDEPVFATAFCVLSEKESLLTRRASTAIKVSRPL
jgi:hypothetical protein